MKTLTPVLATAVALSLLDFPSCLRGQDMSAESPSPSATRALLEKAQSSAETAQREAERLKDEYASAQEAYGALQDLAAFPPDVFAPRVGQFNGGPAARPLIVRGADVDAATQAHLEEDLAIMSHLLGKAVNDEFETRHYGRTAMGIKVFFAPGSRSFRDLYLDGYGALFLLDVDFPLLAPPADKSEPKEKPATDSSWEEAKRELYGAPQDHQAGAENYDSNKVEQLKNIVLNTLKSAGNMRGLKPDDNITVCVFGPPAPGAALMRPAVGTQGGEELLDPASGRAIVGKRMLAVGSGTTLTIRARKSDVDAFAKNKVTLEEFRKKVSITAYAGSANGGNGAWKGAFGSW